MNFNSLKAVKNPQSPTHSLLAEGETLTENKKKHGDINGLQTIFQSCDSCSNRAIHTISRDIVTCLSCGGHYKIQLTKTK